MTDAAGGSGRRLSPTMKRALCHEYDRDLSGRQYVAADLRETLDALERRGLVTGVRLPFYQGGAYVAVITEEGLRMREELRVTGRSRSEVAGRQDLSVKAPSEGDAPATSLHLERGRVEP